MNKKNNLMWVSLSTPKEKVNREMSLEQLMEMLDKKATAKTATVFGEIKGLYAAYKLAPTNVLLEAIIAKCLGVIFEMGEKSADISTPVKSSRAHPSSMEWEWAQGFKHYLAIEQISEGATQVYVRALKQVMNDADNKITNIHDLKNKIEELIKKYSDGRDKQFHNIHIAALRKFKGYMDDKDGYFISVVENDEEKIISRIYCTLELAQQEFEDIISNYSDTVDKIKLYDKFATLVKEVTVK